MPAKCIRSTRATVIVPTHSPGIGGVRLGGGWRGVRLGGGGWRGVRLGGSGDDRFKVSSPDGPAHDQSASPRGEPAHMELVVVSYYLFHL